MRYQKPTKPNLKKDRKVRRLRKPLYWQTGGRQRIHLIVCKDCRTAIKEAKNINARCKMCEKPKPKKPKKKANDVSKPKPKNNTAKPSTA